jgi:manganese efflux pump family protein
MGWITLIGIAVALAMDAFAVAIAAGLQLRPLKGAQVFRLSFHFGLFQALMPIVGWLAGGAVQRYIKDYDHWVAMGLLGFIGGKMVYESLHGAEERAAADPTRGWTLVVLSFATSIDALAVGLSLAMLGVNIWGPSLVIGLVCAGFTAVGMLIGRGAAPGSRWSRRVELIGGLVLIGIGVKIVIEHVLGK